jgi:hypothetical protein
MNLSYASGLYALSRLGFVWLLPLMVISSCIPVAIPWFPKNPYPPEQIEFLDAEDVSRVEVVSKLGPPWANLDGETFVYLASKNSAYVGLATLGGGSLDQPINRDYFLVIDFNEVGIVSGYETYSDSLRHNFCFENGICLESRTFNIPLAPTELDEQAKLFEVVDNKCVVYVYRDTVGVGMSSSAYSDIQSPRGTYKSRRLATSVEHGYSRFEFTPAKFLRMQTETHPPPASGDDIGLFDNDPGGEKKPPSKLVFTCLAGEIYYFRIYVPERYNRPIEFHPVEAEVAKAKISKAKLLLDRREFSNEELKTGNLVQ